MIIAAEIFLRRHPGIVNMFSFVQVVLFHLSSV